MAVELATSLLLHYFYICEKAFIMQDLTIFKNENLGEIRVIIIDNEPLFCLADICKALNIQNSRNVASAIKNEFEGCTLEIHPFETAGGTQNWKL